jgi:hypothetical protein
MPSLQTLKREVEILHKALGTQNDWKQQSEYIEKLNFYNEKLIEFSRIHPTDENGDMQQPDTKALLAWNLEIIEFQSKHSPLTKDDIIKITPYLDTINLAANHCLGNNET